MSNGLGSYAIPADLAKEASNLSASRFHLQVPETVARKKGVARWNESVQVKSASRESRDTQGGDTHTVFTVVTSVLAGSGTPNEGRTYQFSLRVNYDSFARPVDDGQRMMSIGAISRLIDIAKSANILDFDENVGLTDDIITAMFPKKDGDESSVLEGMRFVLVMRDDDNPKKQFNNRNAQDVAAVLPYVEE